ncbi:MAG: nucleotidyltransferase domain-containing protein [Anaerolineales bacterium]|nr:nucleotidyltransferase domain-containing protein [Anaerolineales bacterium]
MPVRSLNSPVLKWPEQHAVHAAVEAWANEIGQKRPEILRIAYIGSYARGDWGVGSDLDVIVILEHCAEPSWRRSLDWDLSAIPVPVDLLVYTRHEWQALAAQGGRFYQTVLNEAKWVFERQ